MYESNSAKVRPELEAIYMIQKTIKNYVKEQLKQIWLP
jgi:hypothetical protein